MTKIEKAHAILNLLNFQTSTVDRLVGTVNEIYGPEAELSEEKFEQKAAVLQTLREVAEETVQLPNNSAAKVYAEIYTDEELMDLINWYSTPLGCKVREQARTIHAQMEQITEDWATKLWTLVRIRMGWDSE